MFFFFNDTATTEIYTLSLHDAFRSDDEFEMDEQSRVVALVQQLRLVSDDFISSQMIKISDQATKLNRLEKEEIDKLSKRIHSQIQLISFNQSQIEKFTELLVQQAREIECASEQIAELEQAQRSEEHTSDPVTSRSRMPSSA